MLNSIGKYDNMQKSYNIKCGERNEADIAIRENK